MTGIHQLEVVARDGIEPSTRGFSVPCFSTQKLVSSFNQLHSNVTNCTDCTAIALFTGFVSNCTWALRYSHLALGEFRFGVDP